ncbi:hypothetical protein H2201_003685 [Coniosporium apollinis]|uniref:DUF7918 domain-containing protein n=1 Tax=Coniosporium apollinis TaxID=61459 RepID=A0ABQ9NX33_9PEZI|nr:hypothetical protein H2201_003685 [Coniosporium apollinis]
MIQDGEFSLRSTWLRGRDGKTYSHRWFFTDVGIETLFDKMALTNDLPANPSIIVEDELLSAMNKTQLAGSKQEPKLGQIKVVLERVTLSETFADPAYKARRADQEDVDMDGARDISHAVKLEHGEAIPSKPVRVVHYDYYQEDEEPYAVFKFFYRSEGDMADVLCKFNFEGFPKPATPSSRNTRSRRKMNDQLNFFTPLSISHPLPPRPADSAVKGRKKTLQSTDDEKHIKTFGSPTKRQSEAGSDDAGDGGADNNKGADENRRKAEFNATDCTFAPKQSDFRLQLDNDGSDPSEGEDNMSGSSTSTVLLSPSSISALKGPINAQPAPLIRSRALELKKKTIHRDDPTSNTFRHLVPPESAFFAPNFDFHSPISASSAFPSSAPRIPSPLSSNSGSTEHDPSSAKSSFKNFRLLEEQSGEDADAEDNDDTDTASIRATRADSAELELEIPDLISPDQDDQGLHTELAKRLLLGKRSRDDEPTATSQDATAEHTGSAAGWAARTEAQGFRHRRGTISGRGAAKTAPSTGSGGRSSDGEGSDQAIKRTKREEESEAMLEQHCT